MKRIYVFLLFFVVLSACSSSDIDVVTTSTSEASSRDFPMITDPNRYSEVLNSTEPDIFFEHFPKEIPPEAINVRFAYHPRIMQGAMILELLVSLPEAEVDELWNEYSDLEQYQFTDDKAFGDIPEPILFLLRDENYELNQDFSIFFIEALPAGNGSANWNHGTMYGIGINKDTQEIIYWFQYW